MWEAKLIVKVVLLKPNILHARALMEFLGAACGFKCAIRIQWGKTVADAKSPMEIAALFERGEGSFVITAEGADAARAMDILRGLGCGIPPKPVRAQRGIADRRAWFEPPMG